MEETFLLLFRFDNPLESSVEFMKVRAGRDIAPWGIASATYSWYWKCVELAPRANVAYMRRSSRDHLGKHA